jgi:hypothetical protein
MAQEMNGARLGQEENWPKIWAKPYKTRVSLVWTSGLDWFGRKTDVDTDVLPPGLHFLPFEYNQKYSNGCKIVQFFRSEGDAHHRSNTIRRSFMHLAAWSFLSRCFNQRWRFMVDANSIGYHFPSSLWEHKINLWQQNGICHNNCTLETILFVIFPCNKYNMMETFPMGSFSERTNHMILQTVLYK